MRYITTMIIGLMILLWSCGPGEAEIRAKIKAEEKEKDSLDKIKANEEPPKKDYNALKKELKTQEKLNPLRHLKCEEFSYEPQWTKTRRGGLFRAAEYAPDGAIFSGMISNNASVAKFKDVKMKIMFYSATNTLIKSYSYTIYDYFPPNSTTPFYFKLDEIPEQQMSAKLKIIRATPY